MINTILEHIALAIAQQVPAISTSAGLAETLEFSSGEQTMRLPVWLPAGEREYKPCFPTSQDSGVCFWRFLGSSVDGVHRKYVDTQAQVQVMLWADLNKIHPPSLDILLAQVLSVATQRITGLGNPVNINMVPQSAEPKNPQLWREWTLVGEDLQLLVPPFDWRAFNFTLQYRTLLDGCSTENVANIPGAC